MVTIEDNDLAIDVVAKLVSGTREVKAPFMNLLNRAAGGDGTEDLFTDDELLEMADYLRIYALHNIYARKEKWICVQDEKPKKDIPVLTICSGKYKNTTFENSFEIATYHPKEGWILESYPAWDSPEILFWMPLPDLPAELKEHGYLSNTCRKDI